MFPNYNSEKLKKSNRKYKFLLDTSAYTSYEEIFIHTGVFVPEVILESQNFDYFLSNDVIVELMNGPRNDNFLKLAKDRILNAEGAFDKTMKHSMSIIEDDGKLNAINLYKISATDMSQIMLCMNHPDLILVSNDEKLIKNATVTLKGNTRIKGVPNSIDLIVQVESQSDKIDVLKDFIWQNRKSIKDFNLMNLKQNGK